MERSRREIVAVEAEIVAGHPDVEGLCLALSDWSVELRIFKRELCERGSGWPQRAEDSPEDREIGTGGGPV